LGRLKPEFGIPDASLGKQVLYMMQHSKTKVIQFERIETGLIETSQGKKSNHFKSPACKIDQFFGTKVMSRNEW